MIEQRSQIAVDAYSGGVIVQVLTDQNISDVGQLDTLLDQIATPIVQFTADEVYDGPPAQREAHVNSIAKMVVCDGKQTKIM